MRLREMAAIGFLGLILGPAAGADTVYTDQATFLANVQPGYYLETFDSLPPGYGVQLSPVVLPGPLRLHGEHSGGRLL